LFLPRSRAGIVFTLLEGAWEPGLFDRTLAVCCSILASWAAGEPEDLVTGDGATALCRAVPGAERTGGTGFFNFWPSAMLPEIRTTATAAVNLIEPSVIWNTIPRSKFRSTRLFSFLKTRGKKLWVIWTSGMMCANLWGEGDPKLPLLPA
jgi:hypothetical protein